MLNADNDGTQALIQQYGQIRQFGLDAQLTASAWLFKLEAIHRTGERNPLGVEKDYAAAVVGGAFALNSDFGSAMDRGVASDWSGDARGDNALPRLGDDRNQQRPKRIGSVAGDAEVPPTI